MMRYLLFLVLTINSLLANSQDQELVFEKFNFSEGNYILYGEISWNTPFNEQLGDFYIDDKNSLKEIQKQWKLFPTRSFTACGHDYDIRLVKNDIVVWYGEYNYECGWIMTDPSNMIGYTIDTLKGQLLKYGANKIKSHTRSFLTLDSLRKTIDSLNLLNNVYVLTSQKWRNHSGHVFYYLEFDEDSIPFDSKSKFEEFKKKLTSILPKDKFYYEFEYEKMENGDLYFYIEIWIRDGYVLPKLPNYLKSDYTYDINPSKYTLHWYERYK